MKNVLAVMQICISIVDGFDVMQNGLSATVCRSIVLQVDLECMQNVQQLCRSPFVLQIDLEMMQMWQQLICIADGLDIDADFLQMC